MKSKLLGAAVMLVAALSAVPAMAGDKNAMYYQGKFEAFSQLIADLKTADAAAEVAGDIEVIRTFIGQGQALLAAEKIEAIDPVLERIVAQASFVRARLDRLSADRAAAAAEKQASEAEAKATEAKRLAEEAAQKNKQLEEQGL
jgi:hypothetical protein